MALINIGLTFTIECEHCRNPLPVNQASEHTLCRNCWREVSTPVNLWQFLVTKRINEACSMELETDTWATGMAAGLGNYRLTFGNLAPRCAGCDTFFNTESLFELAKGGSMKFSCGSCGTVSSVRVPPAWFNKVASMAVLLVGETVPDASGALNGAGEGVSMRCYYCGGPLSLDGSSRTIKCSHCDQDLLVPDDIWLRLHPAVMAQTWYILLDTGDTVALLPDDIDEFIDLQALPGGDTAFIWQEDSEGYIGRAGRNGGFRWLKKGIPLSDYARILYSRSLNLLWVPDREEDITQSFNADTGDTVAVIKNRKNNPDYITAIDHEGIAAAGGTIIVYRCWEDDRYALRRFDSAGKRVSLWPGANDDDFSAKFIEWDNLADRPVRPPGGAWITCSADGTLYFINRDSGHYAVFDKDGFFRGIVEPDCKEVTKIQDCDVSGNGSIYIIFDHKKTIRSNNFSHVGRIDPDGSFHVIAGPHAKKNRFSLGTDLERISVAENGEIHICDRGFDNFRILSPDGALIWRSPATEQEDESRAEELAEALES